MPPRRRRDSQRHRRDPVAAPHLSRGGAAATRRDAAKKTPPLQVTLTDMCATTSAEGQTGACEGTFGMFSAPMTGDEFLAKL